MGSGTPDGQCLSIMLVICMKLDLIAKTIEKMEKVRVRLHTSDPHVVHKHHSQSQKQCQPQQPTQQEESSAPGRQGGSAWIH